MPPKYGSKFRVLVKRRVLRCRMYPPQRNRIRDSRCVSQQRRRPFSSSLPASKSCSKAAAVMVLLIEYAIIVVAASIRAPDDVLNARNLFSGN